MGNVDKDFLLDAAVPISCLLCEADLANNYGLHAVHANGPHYHVLLLKLLLCSQF